MAYAWVEITGKVFVERWELEDKIREMFPALGFTIDDSPIDLCSFEQEREAFQAAAEEKISSMFPTDDPIKYNEALIDMSTYRS